MELLSKLISKSKMDIAITEKGSVLIEENSNHVLSMYEFSFSRRKYGYRDILLSYLDEHIYD